MIKQAADPALTIIYFLERRIIMDYITHDVKRDLMNKLKKGFYCKELKSRWRKICVKDS